MPFYDFDFILGGSYEQKKKTVICKYYCADFSIFHDHSVVCLPHLSLQPDVTGYDFILSESMQKVNEDWSSE